MQIKIPRRAVAIWDAFGDWANVPVYGRLLRIDVLLAVAGLFAVGYYYAMEGWLGAAKGGLLFVFLAMCALWFKPRESE